MGVEPGGLTGAQVRRIITDARAAADVVGFTIAEYFPRQVMHMQQILRGSLWSVIVRRHEIAPVAVIARL